MIPTKDILETKFNWINQDGFNGSLHKSTLTIGHSSTNMGLFIEWGNGRNPEIRISDYFDFDEEVLDTILAHEMCHQWCYEHGYNETHGKHWKEIALEVGTRLGLLIERTVDLKESKVNPKYELKDNIKTMKEMVKKVLDELRKDGFPKENYWLYVTKVGSEFKLKAAESKEDDYIGYFVEDDEKLDKIINLVLTYKKLKKSC